MTNELKHYGILGIRWGKHKAKSNSKHYDKLVSKYSQKGYSSEEASRLAKNRIKTEKALQFLNNTDLLKQVNLLGTIGMTRLYTINLM